MTTSHCLFSKMSNSISQEWTNFNLFLFAKFMAVTTSLSEKKEGRKERSSALPQCQTDTVRKWSDPCFWVKTLCCLKNHRNQRHQISHDLKSVPQTKKGHLTCVVHNPMIEALIQDFPPLFMLNSSLTWRLWLALRHPLFLSVPPALTLNCIFYPSVIRSNLCTRENLYCSSKSQDVFPLLHQYSS